MAPPVGTILWAANRPKDHWDHLHVQPPTEMTGIPPEKNPGMSPGVKTIYDALTERFGKGHYFLASDNKTPIRQVDPSVQWTHMGGWHRRKIAGRDVWSQHSWWNALDIGPYFGPDDQLDFYNFLTGKDTEMAHPIKDHAVYHAQGPNSWGDGPWAEHVALGYTTLNASRTWEARREDIAYVLSRFRVEMEAMATEVVNAAIKKALKDLGSGGVTEKRVAEIVKEVAPGLIAGSILNG